jgi:hypothetical protein
VRKLFACLFCFPLGALALFANELLALECIHGTSPTNIGGF